MAKEKKLTLKYVFHQSIKGVTTPNGETKCPLYVEIIYNREMARFAAASLMPKLDSKDKFKNPFYVSNKEIEVFYKTDLGEKVNAWLQLVLAFEIDTFKDKFTVKGLGTRVKFYTANAFDGLKKVMADRTLKGNVNPNVFMLYHFFYLEFEKHPELKKSIVLEWLLSDKLVINENVENYINSNYEEINTKLIDFFMIMFPDLQIFFDENTQNVKKYIEKRLFLKSE